MSPDVISLVTEVVGVVAVIVSVLYLANQVRQGTEVARSVARQGIADAAMAEASSVVDNPELAKLLYTEISGGSLEPHEEYRLQLFVFRSLRLYENVHYQFTRGMLEPEEWAAFRTNLELLFELNVYNRFWLGQERLFTPLFQELVGEMRSRLESSGRLGTGGMEVMGEGNWGQPKSPGTDST